MGFRKAREVEELTADPAFHYHVGQLIGAMQMAGYVLVLHDDAKVQEVGRRLWESSGWFFEPGATMPTSPPSAADADTKVLPPRAGG